MKKQHPADIQQTTKLLMTWAKKCKKLHVLKIATAIMMQVRMRDGNNPSFTVVINNFYKSAETEERFRKNLIVWERFIKENGTTLQQIEKKQLY